jgi:hypothetical protein
VCYYKLVSFLYCFSFIMTVIHTETHLTSDPVYSEDSAYFNVALSNISVECHIHREECLNYLRENKIRTGDLVKIGGK